MQRPMHPFPSANPAHAHLARKCNIALSRRRGACRPSAPSWSVQGEADEIVLPWTTRCTTRLCQQQPDQLPFSANWTGMPTLFHRCQAGAPADPLAWMADRIAGRPRPVDLAAYHRHAAQPLTPNASGAA